MRNRRRRHPRLRVLDLNTHSGWSIRNGTLAELIARTNPHVLLLQEITPGAKRALRRLLGDAWVIHGVQDSVVCVKRTARFTVVDRWSPDNTLGGEHERHATGLVLHDAWTGRDYWLQSLHVQPLGLGLRRASEGAVKRQTRQLLTYVWRSKTAPEGAVVIDGGDVNQRVDVAPLLRAGRDRLERTVEWLWRGALMYRADTLADRVAGEARLDVFMVRPEPYVQVLRHVVIDTVRDLDDHPALLLVVAIDPVKRERTLAEHRAEVAP